MPVEIEGNETDWGWGGWLAATFSDELENSRFLKDEKESVVPTRVAGKFTML